MYSYHFVIFIIKLSALHNQVIQNKKSGEIASYFNVKLLNSHHTYYYSISDKKFYYLENSKLKKTENSHLDAIKTLYPEPEIIFHLIKTKLEGNKSSLEINNDAISGLHIFDSY